MNGSSPLKALQMTNSTFLHYYKGRLKKTSENKIYFVDHKNVAVVDVNNLYLNGRQVGKSEEDLKIFHSALSSNWNERLEIHSYVEKNFIDPVHQNTQTQLFGKMLWQARIAWVGRMPPEVNNFSRNIVYMPISYYTGNLIVVFEDHVLFGDRRNSVMVNREHFYKKEGKNSAHNMHKIVNFVDPIIHAYVCRIQTLTDRRLMGPQPILPTWPRRNYTSDLWVAKFAWQGPMPVQVKEQVERYYIIRLNKWNLSGCPQWKIGGNFKQIPTDQEEINRINNYNGDKSDLVTETDGKVPWVPMDQEPGIMKGSILIADNKQALMTSFGDVIAFQKENFYVNGEKFRSSFSLGNFFQERNATLTAWVLPLEKLKCIFHINVAWYAPIVWLGVIPTDLKKIQDEHMNSPEMGCGLVESILSSSSLRFTYFLGKLSSLSHTYGVFRSRANQKQVDVAFKRRVMYMHGCKVTSSISLLDRKAVLESTRWSMLAYPVTTDLVTKVRQYCAVAVWHFQDQNYMGMISAILSEVIDDNEISHTGPVSPVEDKEVLHMEGWIVWIDADFGIISSRNKESEPVFLYFKKSLLYIDGELWNDDVSLHEMSAQQQCKVTAEFIPEKDLFGFPISMKATLAWFGVKPRNVQHESFDIKAQESKSPVVNVTCMVKESTAESINPFSVLHAAHGMIIGIVLMTDDDQGLILSNKNIVAFACKRFYINGEKFRHNYSSLSDYCSGRQVNVRAMVVPQQKARVLFGCKVICEAICVWIGKEPNNLKNLEIEYSKQLKETATDNLEKFPPTPGLFYMLGKIIKVSDKMGILSCPTPEGYVNVTFSVNSFFKNGTRLPSGNQLDENFSLSDYSCLVNPVTPKKYYGQTVSFSARAVWKSIDCHKKSDELLQLLASEIHKLCNDIANGKLSKTAPDLNLDEMSTAIQEIEQDKLRNGTTPTLTSRDVMSWMTEEAKEIVKEPGNSSSTKESEIDQEIVEQIPTGNTIKQENLVEPTQEFYGKHMTAYVIQKCEDGGIAQWNSYQLLGYVHIKFSCRIMNIDLRPMSKNFKVTNVQNRSCNFFVRPIPHRTICGYTVSLQATCGWIGKKPPNIPKPGTQELANLSLNEVHVMPLYDLPHVNYEELPSYLREVQELPLVPATQNIKLNQNVHTNSNHNVVVTSPPVTPSTTESSSCYGIWTQRNKREGHHLGTITEVFASMGQLKGEDGKQHFFTKDLCYLYGVVLRNVELWHVLVQGDKVLYTTYESKPGSSKVDCVWLGAVKVDGVQKTALLIHEWCEKNHIPDGAREILINQLDVS